MSLDSARATDLSGRAEKNFLFPVLLIGTIKYMYIALIVHRFLDSSDLEQDLTSFFRRTIDKHSLVENPYLAIRIFPIQ